MEIVGVMPKSVMIVSDQALSTGQELTVTRAGSPVAQLKVVKVEKNTTKDATNWVVQAEVISSTSAVKLGDAVSAKAPPPTQEPPSQPAPEPELPKPSPPAKPEEPQPSPPPKQPEPKQPVPTPESKSKKPKSPPKPAAEGAIFSRPHGELEKHRESDQFREGSPFGPDKASFLFNLVHAAAKKSVQRLRLEKGLRVGVILLYAGPPTPDPALLTALEKPSPKKKRSIPLVGDLLFVAPLLETATDIIPWPAGDYIPLYSLLTRTQRHTIVAAADMPGLPPLPSEWNFVYDALVHQLHNEAKADVVELTSRYYFAPPSRMVGEEDPLQEVVKLAREAQVDVLLLGTLGGSVLKTGNRRIPFYERDYFSARINLTLRAVDVDSGEVLSSSIAQANDTVRTSSRFQFRDLAELVGLGLLIKAKLDN